MLPMTTVLVPLSEVAGDGVGWLKLVRPNFISLRHGMSYKM